MPKKITQKQLAEKYRVSQPFVSKAINGEKNSLTAINIRRDYGRALRRLSEAIVIQNGRLAA